VQGISLFSIYTEADMYEVHGLNKITFKFEMIASEISKQELDLLLEQERENYIGIKVSRLKYR